MRIAITGGRDFLDELAGELEAADGGRPEGIEDAGDDGDLAFSLADIATLIGVIGDALALCHALVKVRDRKRPPTQRLRFKTALGTTEVELSEDITAEELYERLGTIVRR